MKHLNLKEYAVVSDFDGTITLEDTNDMLFLTYGTEKNVEIEDEFRAGRVDDRETMRRHFEVARLTFGDYFSFLDSKVEVDAGFDPFLRYLRRRGVPLFIVSGGYSLGIERVLGEERLEGVRVFANGLVEEEDGCLTLSCATERNVCTESALGPCCNCKKLRIDDIRRETAKKILYIGDGLTDRCAVHKADLLFAKEGRSLAEHCKANGAPYIPFAGFDDIVRYICE